MDDVKKSGLLILIGIIILLLIITPIIKYNKKNKNINENKQQELNQNKKDNNDIREVKKSIVLILTNKSQGSGVVVKSDGVIATNFHVVDYAEFIIVKTINGKEYKAMLINQNTNYDIAVLKINEGNLFSAKIGSSKDLNELEELIAIGNPLGLESTVTKGNFSKYAKLNNLNYSFIQFTAPIEHGSSGGGLFKMDGTLIGITTAKMENTQGFNFAIPIEFVEKILN